MTTIPAHRDLSADGEASTISANPLSADELARIDAYWRAANYLSVGQIYLLDNPLLRVPLTLDHVKPRLLGHWGTTPGLNFVYAHMNRVIKRDDLDAIFIAGPGHGGPGVVANTYLEGTYSEIYPEISRDADGLRKLFKQFSFPGGIPSHASPETPGSINEGGELGYSLLHAYGAAFDNPDLLVCCVIGDGEAETGALATSWHSNKFLNPVHDGVVLPILHLNGYKIAGPTVLARIPKTELSDLLRGYGHRPYFVEGDDPALVHQQMAETLNEILAEIRSIQQGAREHGFTTRPSWPMIVLNTPKGWTGPAFVDGKKIEGTFRSHQVPLAGLASNPEHLRMLEEWMRSYRPEELFDASGRLIPELAELAPTGTRRMGANPHANGGLLLKDLVLPDFRDYALDVRSPGESEGEATRVMGQFLRDVISLNADARNFRMVGPDETTSNRLGDVFDGDAERARLPGLARRLPPDRSSWILLLLRSVHTHRRFDVQPARQVAQNHPRHSVARTHCLPQLPPDIACVATGSQRVQSPGSRIHRPRGQQEGRCHSRLPASRREHVVVSYRSLPPQPQLCQRDRRGQATRAPMARHRVGN